MNLTSVLIRPIITEKSMNNVTKNKFTFEVIKSADKKTIQKAVEQKFKVTVVKIETTTRKGKKKRVGIRRVEVPGAVLKKAIVTLKEGQKIDLFEVGQ